MKWFWTGAQWLAIGIGLLVLCVLLYGVLMALSTQGPMPSP